MVVAQSQSAANGLELVRSCRVLSSGHAGGQVVADDDSDVGVLVDGVEQSGHAAVCESGVTDDSHCRPLSCIRSAFRHRDARAHVDARVNGMERREESECVAADVSENPRVLIVQQHFVECGVHVAVSASLAQGRRTWHYVRAWVVCLVGRQSECSLHHVRGELASAWQFSGQASFYDGVTVHHAAQHVLDEGLSVLNDKHALAFVAHTAYERFRQRILRYFQDGVGAALREALIHVVEGDSACDDAHGLVCTLHVAVVF